jgi:hypothetical protein
MRAKRVLATEFFEFTGIFMLVDLLDSSFVSTAEVVIRTVEEKGLVYFTRELA